MIHKWYWQILFSVFFGKVRITWVVSLCHWWCQCTENPLSSLSIWAKAHKQSTEYGPVTVHLLNEGFLQQTSPKQSVMLGVFQALPCWLLTRAMTAITLDGHEVTSCVKNSLHYLTKYFTCQHVLKVLKKLSIFVESKHLLYTSNLYICSKVACHSWLEP